MQTLAVWKAQAVAHPQQERMQAVMMLMMTSVVGLSQFLLEVVVLLLGLAEQLVSRIVRIYSCLAVACLASRS